jgi:HlyD family secretion protein
MTATVTIHSAKAEGVTKIPNAALRFRPSPPKGPDGKPLPQEPLPKLAKGHGRVYVLVDDTPGAERVEMREVEIGITDGAFTELATELGDGRLVIDEADLGEESGRGRKLF